MTLSSSHDPIVLIEALSAPVRHLAPASHGHADDAQRPHRWDGGWVEDLVTALLRLPRWAPHLTTSPR